MVFTNTGKQFIAYALGSDISNNLIGYVAIGSGSGTALATNSTLIAETDRNPITGSPNFTTARKVQFQADFNSDEARDAVNTDNRGAQELRLNSTPTFLVNGRRLATNPQSYEQFKSLVERELASAE